VSEAAASGRVGVPRPFRMRMFLLAYFNDGARIWNGDSAKWPERIPVGAAADRVGSALSARRCPLG